jgi:hypothetical protein
MADNTSFWPNGGQAVDKDPALAKSPPAYRPPLFYNLRNAGRWPRSEKLVTS